MVATTAIGVTDLHKQYGELEAVGGVNFEVAKGEVFALLGPNGAGKTTTLEILEGYRDRTSGTVSVLGFDPGRDAAQLRRHIGIVLQATAVEPYLSVREVVTRNAGYYPKPRDVDAVIHLVGLDDKATARVKTLSGGQQRRLDVALGIIGDPQLLFLDEPTTGFDPTARRGAWDLVRALAAEGTTILLTTHYMDEAQNLADRVAVIARGHIVAEGTPDTIGGRADAAAVIRFHLPPDVGLDRLPVPAELANGAVEVRTSDEVRVLHALTGWALDNGVGLEQLSVDRPTLEDIYIELTGGAETHAEVTA
jgi:ABC-2 type transport system ATP-binding protein